MRATEDLLDELHGLVAGSLRDQLAAAKAKKARDPDYEVPASLILAAMKFLKDNGIDAPARSPRMSSLASQLKDIDFEAEARPN